MRTSVGLSGNDEDPVLWKASACYWSFACAPIEELRTAYGRWLACVTTVRAIKALSARPNTPFNIRWESSEVPAECPMRHCMKRLDKQASCASAIPALDRQNFYAEIRNTSKGFPYLGNWFHYASCSQQLKQFRPQSPMSLQ